MIRTLLSIGLVAAATQASAQVAPRDSAAPTTLTIEQAIELARRTNPELQQTPARWPAQTTRRSAGFARRCRAAGARAGAGKRDRRIRYAARCAAGRRRTRAAEGPGPSGKESGRDREAAAVPANGHSAAGE